MDSATTDTTPETETPVQRVEEFILGQVLPLLVERLGVSRSLEKIIAEVLTGEDRFDLRRALKRQLQRRITSQEGRNGSELLARAVVKQIDFHYEAEVNELELDDRHKIVTELAENVARHLVLAANHILAYPATAKEVHRCKAESDVRGLAKARMERTFAAEGFKKELINSARAACGDDVVG